MKTIELNEQAVDFLKTMLEFSLNGETYSETSKGIIRHILSKLEDIEECDVCGGIGYVTIGQYDDLKDVRCYKCNPKTSIDEEMDDNS